MAKPNTAFEPNQDWFDNILHAAPIEALVDATAERVADRAKATAPVDTGAYRDEIHLEHRDARYRRVTQVVGGDPKTLLIESKTGNLARALKAAKQG